MSMVTIYDEISTISRVSFTRGLLQKWDSEEIRSRESLLERTRKVPSGCHSNKKSNAERTAKLWQFLSQVSQLCWKRPVCRKFSNPRRALHFWSPREKVKVVTIETAAAAIVVTAGSWKAVGERQEVRGKCEMTSTISAVSLCPPSSPWWKAIPVRENSTLDD